MLKNIFLWLNILFISTSLSCQHSTMESSPPDHLSTEDFLAYTTQVAPQSWHSKARLKALGGRIAYKQVPSSKVLFGMSFEDAKKLVRIIDIRKEDDFKKSNYGMNPEVKAPVINIPEVTFSSEKLENKNLTAESILIFVCENKEVDSKLAGTFLSLGYTRVLHFHKKIQALQYTCSD